MNHRQPHYRRAFLLVLGLWLAAAVPGLPQDEPDISQLRPESANLHPAPEEIPRSIRVVSFNVKLGKDIKALVREMRDNPALSGADIFLLQEIESFPKEEGSSRTRKLAEKLRLNYVYAPARVQVREDKNGKQRTGTHGLAILSRFPLRDIEIIPLPFFKLKIRSRRRIAVAATAMVPGGEIALFNLHLDTRLNSRNRIEQLKPVVEAAAKVSGKPIIIGGDFNTNPFRWLWSSIPWFRSNQAQAVDEYMRESGFAAPLKDSGTTARRGMFRLRLDSLFILGAELNSHGVERGVKISDHYPLWIELAWPPKITDEPNASR